jgi:hypothetical protein
VRQRARVSQVLPAGSIGRVLTGAPVYAPPISEMGIVHPPPSAGCSATAAWPLARRLFRDQEIPVEPGVCLAVTLLSL